VVILYQLLINLVIIQSQLLKKKLNYILPVLFGLALLPVPLLRDLHFESAILAGTIGCFWAGIRSASSFKNDFFETLRILGRIYLAAIPLFILALISGCLTLDGVGFWIFIPFPSAFFGTAIGRLIREFKLPAPKLITILILLFCAFGIWVLEFFSFPQVYFYNHVWGLWPGPIYDESVSLTGSFFYFRWLTFLWIILLWIIPNWSQNLQTKLITALALVSLMFSYLNLDEAGIISPTETIQAQLVGDHQTEHFELFYDDEFYSEDEIEYWSARHEFHFQQITEILEIEWPEGRKIESYLYAHAWQKKKITGAKFTSYVPIWLEQDQLHIAKQQLDRVLKHELVHVISKQFGNNLFNGSWSIGLIEGLAEGIAKDASPRSTLHQIVAAEKPFPSAEEMRSSLSFWGFYGSAGAISYTTAGSFVEYLLNEFPVQPLKKIYAGADFESAYRTSFEELISGWHQALVQTELDSVDQQVSEFIFAQRSLFQKECPHSITQELQLWDDYRFHLADRDTTSAHQVLDKLHHITPKNGLVKDEWARTQLHQQKYEEATNAITPNDTLLTLQVLKADALFLSRGFASADSLLQTIAPDIQHSDARNFNYTLELREDSIQWNYHVERRFQNVFPDSLSLENLNLPNKMLSLNKALQEQNSERIHQYALLLANHSFHPDWFDVYEAAIHELAWSGNIDCAKKWLTSVSSLDLRNRYLERLNEQKDWINFTQNNKIVAD
tara:strand:+ start:158341 stop:160524 length:2184 start_codon:yes stop_codon:yes gene_type:complete